ncbi:MAG TPA: hypothetical protein VHF26_11125 [Trebonia sp.]|nr:hypothetical protein [Trebonia sp.]
MTAPWTAPACVPPVTWSRAVAYVEVTGASHRIPLDVPDELSRPLLEWLR